MGLRIANYQDNRMAAADMHDDGTLYEILIWANSPGRNGEVAQRFGDAMRLIGEPSHAALSVFFKTPVTENIMVRPLPPGTSLVTT